jgi:hypothetical protein
MIRAPQTAVSVKRTSALYVSSQLNMTQCGCGTSEEHPKDAVFDALLP